MCTFDPVTPMIAAMGVGMSLYGASQQASAQESMDEYQSQVAANNAAIAQQQAQNAENQGELNLQQQQIKNATTMDNQKAMMAANGLDLNSGSPLNIQASDQNLGNLDAQSIQNNTISQIYGDDATAMNQQAQSQMDQEKSDLTSWNQSFNLLNTGLSQAPQALSSGAQYIAALS